MIAGRVLTLFSSEGVTASVNGNSVIADSPAKACILRLTAVENSGTSTLDVKVQHSPTGATNTWKDVSSFTQLSASGMEDIHLTDITRVLWSCFRVVVTVSGTGNWDIDVIMGISI